MIKNLVFDCGKVLVDYNARDIVGSYVDNYEDLKTVAEVMLDRKYWDRLDAGLISDEELKADAVTRLPERLRKPAC
ncbi:MAG: HAD family phosphatase, partial [Lachnospiraceae bacterium]|nr:HAD family phosphatase [Lachnospiraceae bacterium]